MDPRHLKVPHSREKSVRQVPRLLWTKFSESQLEEIVKDEKLISADSKCIRSKIDLARLCERRLDPSQYFKWAVVFRENSAALGNRAVDRTNRWAQQKVVESATPPPPRKVEVVSLDHVEQNILDSMQMLSTSLRCQTKTRNLPPDGGVTDFKNTPLAPPLEEMNDFEDDLNEAALTPLLVFKPERKALEELVLSEVSSRSSSQRTPGMTQAQRSARSSAPAVPPSGQMPSLTSVPRMRALQPAPSAIHQSRVPVKIVDPKNSSSYEDELMCRTTSCTSGLVAESRVITEDVGPPPPGSQRRWWALLVVCLAGVAAGMCALRAARRGTAAAGVEGEVLPFFCGLDWMETGCTQCPRGAECSSGIASCGSFRRLERVGSNEWICASYENELEKVMNDGISRVTTFLRGLEPAVVSCGEPAMEEEGFVDILWLFDEFVSSDGGIAAPEMRSDLMKLFMRSILSNKTLTKLSLAKSQGSELKIKSVKRQFSARCRFRRNIHSWVLVVGSLLACLCGRILFLYYVDHHRQTAIVNYIRQHTFIDKTDFASGPLLEDIQTWCHINKYPPTVSDRLVRALLLGHGDVANTKLRNSSQVSFFSPSKALELLQQQQHR